jgi:hypothetical protein
MSNSEEQIINFSFASGLRLLLALNGEVSGSENIDEAVLARAQRK